MSHSTAIQGPHGRIVVDSGRDRFCAEVFDELWNRYRQRVSYVADYEQVIAAAGATFVNDHIAFRTIATQRPLAGIASISRIFTALGYRAAGVYHFEDKHLSAIHFQHPNGQFPKLFISELNLWELSSGSRAILSKLVSSHRALPEDSILAELAAVGDQTPRRSDLLRTVVQQFHDLPWELPERSEVLALNQESQYAAWVAVHGYNVNHFTSLINSHGVAELGDIDKTVAALKAAGIPMKTEIEGAAGSKLRQTATDAVMMDVEVRESGRPSHMSWTYAYFELAERGIVMDPQTNRPCRFEGFLGPQATNLFEMTRVQR